MKILSDNLAMALVIAINTRSEEEKEAGYRGDSAFLAGLRSVLEAIRHGEQIIVK